jgi:hypothetical protein
MGPIVTPYIVGRWGEAQILNLPKPYPVRTRKTNPNKFAMYICATLTGPSTCLMARLRYFRR